MLYPKQYPILGINNGQDSVYYNNNSYLNNWNQNPYTTLQNQTYVTEIPYSGTDIQSGLEFDASQITGQCGSARSWSNQLSSGLGSTMCSQSNIRQSNPASAIFSYAEDSFIEDIQKTSNNSINSCDSLNSCNGCIPEIFATESGDLDVVAVSAAAVASILAVLLLASIVKNVKQANQKESLANQNKSLKDVIRTEFEEMGSQHKKEAPPSTYIKDITAELAAIEKEGIVLQ